MTPAILSEDKVRLGVTCATKWDAIAAAADLLIDAHHVSPGYSALMAERERIGTTYIGNSVALPHGTREAMALVQSPGISVLQIPRGVDFGGGNIARLVLGLAARDDSHLQFLTHIATVCADETRLEFLMRATSARDVVAALQPNQDQ
jgi:mannitol PTS system EIIA component